MLQNATDTPHPDHPNAFVIGHLRGMEVVYSPHREATDLHHIREIAEIRKFIRASGGTLIDGRKRGKA
jgi:hypothetical protein